VAENERNERRQVSSLADNALQNWITEGTTVVKGRYGNVRGGGTTGKKRRKGGKRRKGREKNETPPE